jgi:type II secretory pathway pseudopilin PulG
MRHIHTAIEKGYTLIELLLYAALLGILLAATTTYFGVVLESRVKNQSITEVDQQGMAAMEYITQTIRNADSITSPAAGATAASLTLVVPTGALSPTIFSNDGSGGTGGTATLGYDQDGGTTDTADANAMNATGFVASVSGTITTVKALVGNVVEASPNNRAQVAIYRGATGPSTLLSNSVTTILTANSWNTFTVPSTSISAGDKIWIAYNTNALGAGGNNLRYRTGTSGQSLFQAQSYGSWPASWVGAGRAIEFSIYATVTTTANIGAIQVKEGAAANIPLTNGKVQVSNLSFSNLTGSGTPGAVQVNFTIYRINPNNRNEYDYQKTFTSTAALR